MPKIEDDLEKTLEGKSEKKQQTEGIIEDYDSKHLKERLQKVLPQYVSPEQVVVFYGPKGWMWRLRWKYIKDPEIQRRYKEEEEAWPE